MSLQNGLQMFPQFAERIAIAGSRRVLRYFEGFGNLAKSESALDLEGDDFGEFKSKFSDR